MDVAYLGSLEGLTYGNKDDKFDGLFIGAWIGSVYVLELDTNEGNELGLPDEKVLGATLGAAEWPIIGTYDDK